MHPRNRVPISEKGESFLLNEVSRGAGAGVEAVVRNWPLASF